MRIIFEVLGVRSIVARSHVPHLVKFINTLYNTAKIQQYF
nr:MAG TPA: hypothetical protein [Caudoviricetes sp.]DAY21978.1 MAG TPA: hypothetical protein [Bacteriophage sp.]DAI10569.1 MAG TPA: hypothetical protein [Caudoviricetes sp.]DAJ53041.1 MAG TPA: hypothetical protein [Caudoviricetes sp.]DAQ61440.1 MAG TPA: hypothetical protein [Caudoviricetes sp.]